MFQNSLSSFHFNYSFNLEKTQMLLVINPLHLLKDCVAADMGSKMFNNKFWWHSSHHWFTAEVILIHVHQRKCLVNYNGEWWIIKSMKRPPSSGGIGGRQLELSGIADLCCSGWSWASSFILGTIKAPAKEQPFWRKWLMSAPSFLAHFYRHHPCWICSTWTPRRELLSIHRDVRFKSFVFTLTFNLQC